MNETACRAHIYCRVSSAGQEDGYSLSTQEAACRAWAGEASLWPRSPMKSGAAGIVTGRNSMRSWTGSYPATSYSATTLTDSAAVVRSIPPSSSTASNLPGRRSRS